MDNTIRQVSSKKCTGCGACYNFCPVSAISMVQNSEGFLFPKIDNSKCIQCGLCKEHCPELNLEFVEGYRCADPACYAMTAQEDIRAQSSSGGMFSVLADYILENKGYVCGAAFSDDYYSVRHIIAHTKEELLPIRKSKYVQSDTQDTYRQIEVYLKEGSMVLYSGTPCQIAGLRAYLKKEYTNLLTVDIICHGVPSPKVYQKYVREKGNGSALKEVNFREKEFWGWGTASSLFYENGKVYRNDCFRDEYWKAFLGGMSTRECCGTCKYANSERIGDITIGDFWGVKELDQSCDDGKGTSLVFVNSETGKAFFEKVREGCSHLQEFSKNEIVELAKRRNGQLCHPQTNHWARKRFFELLDTKSVKVAFENALYSKYDVGITGWWYNENYGGTLTYYALHQVLKKMGLTVLMIAKCSPDKNYAPNKQSVPYRFALKNYYISKNHTPQDIGKLNNNCNTFISGSDQLFNPTLWPYSGPQYFLDYVSPDKNIISYASSFGNEYRDVGNLKLRMSYWLNRFNALSVRESYGVDICRDVFGLEAKKVLDPVFLCDVKEFEKQAQKSKVKINNPYLLSFFLDPNEEKKQAILYLSDKLKLPYENLLNAMDFEKNVNALNLENTHPNIDIEDWLNDYSKADFIITDSFHGTCFAIIFRKKFISVANYQRGANRFISLLEEFGLMDRLVKDIKEIERRPELFEEIDYDAVFARIKPVIQESYKWLENAVKHPKAREVNTFNSLNAQLEQLRCELYNLQLEEEKEKLKALRNEVEILKKNEELRALQSEMEALRSEVQQLKNRSIDGKLRVVYRKMRKVYRKFKGKRISEDNAKSD